MAPAWPMRLPGSHASDVDTTGLVTLALMKAAASFGGTADLADHDDGFGLRIFLEQLQDVDEVGAGIGSPPMPTQVDWPKPASVVCFTAS